MLLPHLLSQQIYHFRSTCIGVGKGVLQFWGKLGPLPLDMGMADPLGTCYSTTCVTLPSFVILSQTICA